MKKLFVFLIFLTINLFAQGVDYYKQQAKKLPVEAVIMIDHDTLTFHQMDYLRKTIMMLSEKYHLDARLVLRRYDKNHIAETSYNYKSSGKPYYLIYDTVYEDYLSEKAWVKHKEKAKRFSRDEAMFELRSMFKRGDQEYSTNKFEDYPIIVIPVFSKK